MAHNIEVNLFMSFTIVYEYTHPDEGRMKELVKCILQIQEAAAQGLVLSDEERNQLEHSRAVVQVYVDENYDMEGAEGS